MAAAGGRSSSPGTQRRAPPSSISGRVRDISHSSSHRSSARSGAVLAVDVRRESLAFLWIRRFLRDARNVRVIHGEPDDPHLPAGTADAVLIANTYHELSAPGPILDAVFRAMKPGARLVIVDRTARNMTVSASASDAGHHEVPLGDRRPRDPPARVRDARSRRPVHRSARRRRRLVDDRRAEAVTAHLPLVNVDDVRDALSRQGVQRQPAAQDAGRSRRLRFSAGAGRQSHRHGGEKDAM